MSRLWRADPQFLENRALEAVVQQSMTTGEVRPQNNNVVPLKTACEIADLSVSTMRRLIKAKRGPRVLKLSERRIGVRRGDLDAWLASRGQDAAG